MRVTVWPFALAMGFALAACRSYSPSPIGWEEEIARGVTNEVRISSADDAAMLALVGNRQLNAMRLKAAGSADVALQSRWWEDPELDFDLLRIVEPSSHPFLGGASLSFTLPLTGVNSRETKAAELYAEAERAEVAASELEIASLARQSAIRIHALRRSLKTLDGYESDARVLRARSAVERLHQAGEVSATSLASVRRSIHVRHHAAMDIERSLAEAEIELLGLLGLRNACRLVVDLSNETLPDAVPAPVDVRRLVGHPKVRAAVLRHGGSEAKLDAEIRRQYPQLKLGPAYANEEGLDRIGLVAGLTLPLWNRNRKGIAQAESDRRIEENSARDVWRSTVCEAAKAHAILNHLLAHPTAPANARREADALADAGEMTPLDYLSVRDEILDQKLSEIEWRRDVALAVAELEKYSAGARQ